MILKSDIKQGGQETFGLSEKVRLGGTVVNLMGELTSRFLRRLIRSIRLPDGSLRFDVVGNRRFLLLALAILRLLVFARTEMIHSHDEERIDEPVHRGFVLASSLLPSHDLRSRERYPFKD